MVQSRDDNTIPTTPVVPNTPTPKTTAKPKVKAPTIDDVLSKCKKAEDFWRYRNDRFIRHNDLFELQEQTAPKGQILAYMNDPKVLIEKLSGMVARRKQRVQCPARSEDLMDVAQRIENGCRQWDQHVENGWFEGIHNPLAYDRAQSLFLRGWLTERIMLSTEPDNDMLVDDVLFDPYNIYPGLAGQKIQYVSHIFKTTREDLTNSFDEARKRWKDEDLDKEVQCYSYYSNVAPYWHAIIADGEWVKKPAALDYFPWVIAVAKGAIGHFPIGDRQPEEHAEFIGCGFLDAIEGVYDLVNKFITILANAVAKQENPPKVIHTVDGQPKLIDLDTGGTSWLLGNERVELMDVGPKIGQLMPLLSALQDRMNKGGLPSALFGEGTSLDSGFMSALLMGAAQDTIWTFVNALASFHQLRYKKFLTIFERFSDTGIDILVKAGGKNKKSGRKVFSGKLTAEDVGNNGTYVEVTYDDISPQDKVALANVAAMLTREKVISMFTAREKFLGLDDPELEESRVLADVLLMNPEFMKKAALLEWKKLGKHKELAKLIKEIEQEELETKKAMQQQGNPMQQPQQGNAPTQTNGGGLPPELQEMVTQLGFQEGLSGAPGANALSGGPPPENIMGLPPELNPSGVTPGNMAPGPQELIERQLRQ